MMDRRSLWLLVPATTLLIGLGTETLRPGIYMDAVNPDYLVVRLLSSTSPLLPHWLLPGNLLFDKFPILGNIYYGSLPFWIGLPFYALFGTDVLGIRITHAAFAFLIIASAWQMLIRVGTEPWIAALFLAAMAIDPAFHFMFRTQFYIIAIPIMFLFLSLSLACAAVGNAGPPKVSSIVLSGLASGLAAYGYFVYYFYAAVIAVLVIATRRRAVFVPWIAGAALGFAPVFVGLILFTIARGSASAISGQASALLGFASTAGLWERLGHTFTLWRLAYDGQGANLMIFQSEVAVNLGWLRVIVLLVIPVLVFAASEVLRRPSRALRALLAITVVPPLVYGLIFAERLWVHHFVPVVPLVYCLVAIAFSLLSKAAGRLRRRCSIAAGTLAFAFVLVNAVNFQAVAYQLRVTGGVGLVSDAINRFSWNAIGDRALYIFPDWGLFMQFMMITHGKNPISLQFNPEGVRKALCSGEDVVLASIGPGGESRSRERISVVDWSEPEQIKFTQRDGTPVIYYVRWRATSQPRLPC